MRDQQLFLPGMGHRPAAPTSAPRPRGVPGRPAPPPPPPAARPYSRHPQLRLFPDALPRVYSYRPADGAQDAVGDPAPDNEWLAWGLYLAHTMAETRGWKPSLRRGMRRTLVMLLSQHTDGDVIRTSEFHTLVAGHSTNLEHTRQILDTMRLMQNPFSGSERAAVRNAR